MMEYNAETSAQHNVLIINRPNIPSAEERVITYNVPGRGGVLMQHLGIYEDIEINVECNFSGIKENVIEKWRNISRWLKEAPGELTFSDDPEWYYKVKSTYVPELQRILKTAGVFAVTFICEGYAYKKSGVKEHEINEVLYNPYSACNPLYVINGNGTCILEVNGNEIEVQVEGDIIINTDMKMSYRSDGENMNTFVKGDYDELKIIPGDNEIKISDGFKLKVVPNWRCIQ